MLSLGFMHNTWNTVGRKWFVEWKSVQDTYFVGRLVQSRQDGIFSYAGFFGHGDVSRYTDQAELVRHQYDAYIEGKSFSEFNPYKSTTAAQGMLFSLFDQITTHPPQANLSIFRWLTSILSAAVLGLLVVWFYSEYGFVSALFAGGFMIVSEWLTLFGGVIYWSLWAFYLPLIALLFYLRKQRSPSDTGKIAVIVFITILIKCVFNGFAYITTVLVMVFLPLIYYGVINQWERRPAINILIATLVAESLAVIIALVILVCQNAVVLGGLGKAFEYIEYSLNKRALGNPGEFSGALAEGLKADYFTVLKEYVTGRAIKLDLGFITDRIPGWPIEQLEIGYIWIFYLFLAGSLLFFLIRSRLPETGKTRVQSLILVTWLSVLAPLSWFILFKAHSYLHAHLNFIIWQIPFTLFGFAMCGAVIQLSFSKALK